MVHSQMAKEFLWASVNGNHLPPLLLNILGIANSYLTKAWPGNFQMEILTLILNLYCLLVITTYLP